MHFTILDCYTDEPAGLGVPPYIGTYPRYIAGAVLDSKHSFDYVTIDDLRFYVKYSSKKGKEIKTNIKIRNLTGGDIIKIFDKSDYLIIISGIHTPGKYLSAFPGTTKEVIELLKNINHPNTILTGPAAYGSGLYGGKVSRTIERDLEYFDHVIADIEYKFDELFDNVLEDIKIEKDYKKINKKIIKGAALADLVPHKEFAIAEIETSSGCSRKKGCSFCTEPLKYCGIQRREIKDIVDEVKALSENGVKYFRLGKQTCFYSYGTDAEIEKLLKNTRTYSKILHIDNANPAQVNEKKTKSIVKYCTPGNIAAFGVESFDPKVVKANNLNSDPETTYKAVKIINKYGAIRADNGMHKFLPGINILFGLKDENKATHEENMFWLKKYLDENLLLRRINIRQVVAFPGTQLHKECGDKFIKKNKKYYWKWRNDIRQKVDWPMLQKLMPMGTVMKGLRTEIHDGNTTFARQIGTYPLIVGIKKRLELDKMIDVRITSHMLRSLVGEEL